MHNDLLFTFLYFHVQSKNSKSLGILDQLKCLVFIFWNSQKQLTGQTLNCTLNCILIQNSHYMFSSYRPFTAE